MESLGSKPKIGTARKLARKLLSDAGITCPPIKLREVVRYLRDNNELAVHAWDFGERTDGIQITDEEFTSIGYNQNQHPHRQRFTVAHEIGHMLMGHTKFDSTVDLSSNKPSEVEANQFAAELLVPLEMLKADVSSGLTNVKNLANKYEVSEEAMWWRLMDTQLDKKL